MFLFPSGARLAEADWQHCSQCQGGFGTGLSQGGAIFVYLCHIFMLFLFLHHCDIVMVKVRSALVEAIKAANQKAVSRANKVDTYKTHFCWQSSGFLVDNNMVFLSTIIWFSCWQSSGFLVDNHLDFRFKSLSCFQPTSASVQENWRQHWRSLFKQLKRVNCLSICISVWPIRSFKNTSTHSSCPQVKRHFVVEKYKSEIDQLYAAAAETSENTELWYQTQLQIQYTQFCMLFSSMTLYYGCIIK